MCGLRPVRVRQRRFVLQPRVAAQRLPWDYGHIKDQPHRGLWRGGEASEADCRPRSVAIRAISQTVRRPFGTGVRGERISPTGSVALHPWLHAYVPSGRLAAWWPDMVSGIWQRPIYHTPEAVAPKTTPDPFYLHFAVLIAAAMWRLRSAMAWLIAAAKPS